MDNGDEIPEQALQAATLADFPGNRKQMVAALQCFTRRCAHGKADEVTCSKNNKRWRRDAFRERLFIATYVLLRVWDSIKELSGRSLPSDEAERAAFARDAKAAADNDAAIRTLIREICEEHFLRPPILARINAGIDHTGQARCPASP